MVNTFSLPLSTIIFIQNGHDVKSVWLGCQRADKGWLAEQRYRTNCQQQTKCYFDGVKRPNYKEREWREKKKKTTLSLYCLVFWVPFERAVEREGLSIHLAHNTHTV